MKFSLQFRRDDHPHHVFDGDSSCFANVAVILIDVDDVAIQSEGWEENKQEEMKWPLKCVFLLFSSDYHLIVMRQNLNEFSLEFQSEYVILVIQSFYYLSQSWHKTWMNQSITRGDDFVVGFYCMMIRIISKQKQTGEAHFLKKKKESKKKRNHDLQEFNSFKSGEEKKENHVTRMKNCVWERRRERETGMDRWMRRLGGRNEELILIIVKGRGIMMEKIVIPRDSHQIDEYIVVHQMYPMKRKTRKSWKKRNYH